MLYQWCFADGHSAGIGVATLVAAIIILVLDAWEIIMGARGVGLE